MRAGVVVVLAGIGYSLFIPQTRPDDKQMAQLVISHSALSSVPRKAALSQSIPASSSTFAVTRKVARQHPDETGLYGREWYVTSAAPPEVGVVLQLLPTPALASSVFSNVKTQLSKAPTLQGATVTSSVSFTVPSVPDAIGESYLLLDSTAPSPTPVGTAYSAAYRVGRVVVSELIDSTSTTRSTTAMVSDVEAGATLLARTEPGFSLDRTTYPMTASLVYGAAAVVLAAGVVVLPELFVSLHRRRRQRHHDRERRRAREQYAVRGRRTVRRQRAPAWSQQRRR